MQRIRPIIVALITALGLSGQSAAAHDTSLAAFFDLVAIGSLESVSEALSHEPDLAFTADANGFSAVHSLDYLGFAEKLTLLQRYGADVNARNDEGHALLHMIIEPALIPAAVLAGADVNLKDHKGRTPLMIHMQESDSADFLPAFIAAGADVNARDTKGKSVLDYAAYFESPKLTQMLVTAGAEP